MAGMACSDYGATEEAAFVVGVAASIPHIDTQHIGDTTCADARRRLQTSSDNASSAVAIAFTIEIAVADVDDDTVLSGGGTALQSAIQTTLASAVSSGNLTSNIVAAHAALLANATNASAAAPSIFESVTVTGFVIQTFGPTAAPTLAPTTASPTTAAPSAMPTAAPTARDDAARSPGLAIWIYPVCGAFFGAFALAAYYAMKGKPALPKRAAVYAAADDDEAKAEPATPPPPTEKELELARFAEIKVQFARAAGKAKLTTPRDNGVTTVYADEDDGGEGAARVEAEFEAHLCALFEAADTDGNHTLDKREFPGFLRSLQLNLTEDDYEEVFRACNCAHVDAQIAAEVKAKPDADADGEDFAPATEAFMEALGEDDAMAAAAAASDTSVAALRHAESLARNQLEAEYKAEEQHEKADLKRRLEERKSKRKLLAGTPENDISAAAAATSKPGLARQESLSEAEYAERRLALQHQESFARHQLETEYKAEEQQEKSDLKRRLEERKSQRKLLAATSDTAASAPATEARAASEPAAGDNPASADELDSETVDLAEALIIIKAEIIRMYGSLENYLHVASGEIF